MKNDFLIAITQLSAEKNLPKETVLEAVELALASAFKKESQGLGPNLSVKINPNTGEMTVYSQKKVVESPSDPTVEISLEEARQNRASAQLGDILEIVTIPRNAGRIAAQTAKQVVMQRLREAEREVVYEEFSNKEGDVVTGVIQRVEPKQIILDLGKTEAVLPITEQVRSEQYRTGRRLKVYIVDVYRMARGPQVVVSRTHSGLLRRLFEMEVPEVFNGTVEIKTIAREPGYRSKVAVEARQEGVDPVGSCVGLRGIRIQNIVNELNAERVDVVLWDSDPGVFVGNALSPAQVLNVSIKEAEKTATVVVADRQLSLAIGREGQNARLAAKLTGWRIDIKSASVAEAERALEAEQEAEEAAARAAEAALAAVPETAEEVAILAEQEATLVEASMTAPLTRESAPAPVLEEEEGSSEPTAILETEQAKPLTEVPLKPVAVPQRPRIRFAEDVLSPQAPPKAGGKAKKSKGKGKRGEPEGPEELEALAKAPKGRVHQQAKKARQTRYVEEEGEEGEEGAEDKYEEYVPTKWSEQ